MRWRRMSETSFKQGDNVYKRCESAPDVVLKALSCDEPVEPADTLKELAVKGFIDVRSGMKADSATCWSLSPAYRIDGLEFSSVCAASEDPSMIKRYPELFWRGPGTSAGTFIAFGTRADKAAIANWMSRSGVYEDRLFSPSISSEDPSELRCDVDRM
jgi:hypothetical protein